MTGRCVVDVCIDGVPLHRACVGFVDRSFRYWFELALWTFD